MKKFGFLALFAVVIGLASAPSAHAYSWLKYLVGISIDFGMNVPDCKCCYNGLCHISLNSATVNNGNFDDAVLSAEASNLSINQALVATRDDGQVFLIVRADNPRPEFASGQFTLDFAPEWDDYITQEFGISGMSPGTYQVIDNNGLFKMIPLGQ